MTDTTLRETVVGERTDAVRETVITWRRRLHMDPELSFHEVRTAQFVADTIGAIGGFRFHGPRPPVC